MDFYHSAWAVFLLFIFSAQNTINLTHEYACNPRTDFFIAQQQSVKVCVLIVTFHEGILDAIVIGKLEIIKRVVLGTLGKTLLKFGILEQQVSNLHSGFCGEIRTVLLIIESVYLVNDLRETLFLFLLHAGGLRLLDLHFRLRLDFRLLVLAGLFLPEFADGDLIGNIKVIPAAADIDFLDEITQEVVPFVQFEIFIRRSLNKEAVSLEEAANGLNDSLLVGFGLLFDLLHSNIEKVPHPTALPDTDSR